jgi:hypothetical protein
MSGRVVSDIGERLYGWYNPDANALYIVVKRLDENIPILQQFKINE